MTFSKALVSASVAALVSMTALPTAASAAPFSAAALSAPVAEAGTTNVWTRCRVKRIRVWSYRYNCYVWKKRRVCW
ncbi:MAG: hypothetical protein AAF318_04830 [Pseudomonadota bacterium]